MEVVHIGYRHVTTADDKVIGHKDGGHGTQENGVTTEESKELGGRCEDFPLWMWLADE